MNLGKLPDLATDFAESASNTIRSVLNGVKARLTDAVPAFGRYSPWSSTEKVWHGTKLAVLFVALAVTSIPPNIGSVGFAVAAADEIKTDIEVSHQAEANASKCASHHHKIT